MSDREVLILGLALVVGLVLGVIVSVLLSIRRIADEAAARATLTENAKGTTDLLNKTIMLLDLKERMVQNYEKERSFYQAALAARTPR